MEYSLICKGISDKGHVVAEQTSQLISSIEMVAIQAKFMLESHDDNRIVRVVFDIALPICD